MGYYVQREDDFIIAAYTLMQDGIAEEYLEDDNSDLIEFLSHLSLTSAKTPTTIATAKLTITDGVVEGFTVDSYISGGFQIDTGKFLMFFASPFEDVNYIVNTFDGGLYRCYVQPDDYYADSFVVTTTDLAGAPADPACISIIVMKAI